MLSQQLLALKAKKVLRGQNAKEGTPNLKPCSPVLLGIVQVFVFQRQLVIFVFQRQLVIFVFQRQLVLFLYQQLRDVYGNVGRDAP